MTDHAFKRNELMRRAVLAAVGVDCPGSTPEPPRKFEDLAPAAAGFIVAVYAAGGKFVPTMPTSLRRICGVARSVACPCGSGDKAKRCHPNWC